VHHEGGLHDGLALDGVAGLGQFHALERAQEGHGATAGVVDVDAVVLGPGVLLLTG